MTVEIYIDGCFNKATKKYGGGVCVLPPDGRMKTNIWGGDNPAFAKHQSIAGEILAAINGIHMAMQYSPTSITIYHTSESLGAWARGESKAKSALAKGYVAFVKAQEVPVYFAQIQTYEPNFYINEVNKLARLGAGLRVD